MIQDVIQHLYAQAQRHPDTIAVKSKKEQVSYKQFIDRVAGYYSIFKKNNVQRVALLLNSGADAFSAMMAALAHNAEYAPLNVKTPQSRLKSMLDRYQPDCIVAHPELFDRLQSVTSTLILNPQQIEPRTFELPARFDENITAYTIFTSGSTGEPKGVRISRRGLNSYVNWIVTSMPVHAGERWSQHPNIAFDLSVMDIYGALCQGATLIVATSEMDRLFPAQFIKEYAINIWNSVPSIFDLIDQSQQLTQEYLSSLRFISFCGEPLRSGLLKKIVHSLPAATVQNTYGPTEATVSCTAVRFNKNNIDTLPEGNVALGQAIPGIELHIDCQRGDNERVQEGELIIYGHQVGQGYLNDETLSRQRFFDLTDSQGKVKRGFRSGDKVRRIGEDFYFISRLDDSYKIKGHFVDLHGVETVLAHLLQQNIVCTVYQNQLHGFVLQPINMTLQALRAHCASMLMDYELPVAIHCVEKIPMTINDKIDRNSLNKKIR